IEYYAYYPFLRAARTGQTVTEQILSRPQIANAIAHAGTVVGGEKTRDCWGAVPNRRRNRALAYRIVRSAVAARAKYCK
ncbi:hypothetical protein QN346_21230, partial [Undibacterium sp. 5I1]